MIDLAVTAANDDEGMQLGELRAALDRLVTAGAPEDGPVRVIVSRVHRVRRVEVRFDNPDEPDAPPPAEPLPPEPPRDDAAGS